MTSTLESPPVRISASLEVRDLFKIFRAAEVQTVALRGVSFKVAPGEFVSIVGRSGSGKSTLFGVLAGLLEPSAGSVLLDGQDLTQLSDDGRAKLRRQRLGVTFQRDNLLPFLSALENVELPLKMSGQPRATQQARALLAELGLENRIHSRPAQLSGGEQASAGLAVALAHGPGLLLADEPTGELDSSSTLAVMNLLERLHREGLTLLVVTHNPEVAARAGRQIRLTDGVLSEVGLEEIL